MFGRFRAPSDPHSIVIVSVASIATVYYTMYPWIQEQKERKRQEAHERFQLLKQADPIAAQTFINELSTEENWIQKKYREIAEKQSLKVRLQDDYYDTRASNMYTSQNIKFPSDIFDPLPEGTPKLHFPTVHEINASLLRGKTLSTPKPNQVFHPESNQQLVEEKTNV
jgi:hypothetical protein